MKKSMKRSTFIVSVVLMLAVLCSACSSGGAASQKNSAAGSHDMYYETTVAATATTTAGAAFSPGSALGNAQPHIEESADLYAPSDGRKMVRNASIVLQSERYDESLAAIQAQILSLGGYIETSSTSGSNSGRSRHLNMTLRIPAENFDQFMSAKDSFGVVQESNIWQEDVTFSYTDREARLETLRGKKERLLSLLEKASRMSDIIELENALNETIYEIETHTSSLSRLDNLISYCTVQVHLYEVYKADLVQEMPQSLGERISQEFSKSLTATLTFLENTLVFLIGASPILILIGVAAGVVVFFSVKTSRRNRRKYEEYLQKNPRVPPYGNSPAQNTGKQDDTPEDKK